MNTTEQKLTEFMIAHIPDMTSEWFENVYTSGVGVYADKRDSAAFTELRELNRIFNEAITESIIGKDAKLEKWAEEVGSSRNRTGTPLYDVIANFSIFKKIYYRYLNMFIDDQGNDVTAKKVMEWVRVISSKFDEAVQLVTRTYIKDYERIFTSQQETILALETPVIKIDEQTGIIPLVGEIDTYRAYKLAESSLVKASDLQLEYVILDLSGVPIIDTMVANQIFQLCDSFNLLGMEMYITGMRPEIAQTSINLGLDFSRLVSFAHLYQAIQYIRKKEEKDAGKEPGSVMSLS